VEAVVSVTLIGIGVASTLGALTKFNSIAAISRNATGASSLVMNQIDLFQSIGPFNPQKTNNDLTVQIPKFTETTNNPLGLPSYDMTLGTHTIGYKDPITGAVSDKWPVYREPATWTYADAATRTAATGFSLGDVGKLAFQSDNQTFWRLQTTAPTWTADPSGGLIVTGTMTVDVSDLNPGTTTTYLYKCVVTIAYQYLGRGPIWSAARNRWEYQLSMTAVRTSDI
jgi:hypothetical protein